MTCKLSSDEAEKLSDFRLPSLPAYMILDKKSGALFSSEHMSGTDVNPTEKRQLGKVLQIVKILEAPAGFFVYFEVFKINQGNLDFIDPDLNPAGKALPEIYP